MVIILNDTAYRKGIIMKVLIISGAVLLLIFLIYKYINDRRIDHLQNLGDLNYINENYKEALKDYDELLKIDPDNTNARLSLGKAYLYSGDTDKGMELLKGILNSDKSDSIIKDSIFNAVSQQSKIFYNDNNMDKALSLTKFALEIKKNDENMVLQISEIYLKNGNINEAEKYAEIMKTFSNTDKYKKIMTALYIKKADDAAISDVNTSVNYFIQAAALGYDLKSDDTYKNVIQKVAQGFLPEGTPDTVPAYAAGDIDNDKIDEIAVYNYTTEELLLYKYNNGQYQQAAKIGNTQDQFTLTGSLSQIVMGSISPKLKGIVVDCANSDGSAFSDIFTFDGTSLKEVHSFKQPFAQPAKDVNNDGIYETGDCRYGTASSTAADGSQTAGPAKIVDWYQLDDSLNTKLITTQNIQDTNTQ